MWGDEFVFERYGLADDSWHMGLNTLKQTAHTAEHVAEGELEAVVESCGDFNINRNR